MSSIFDIIQRDFDAGKREANLAVCNAATAPFGLALTPENITALDAHRKEMLQRTDRVEFGTPAYVQLAEGFASSPYLQQDEYAGNLEELQECFYELRSLADCDTFDEEIIDGMRLLWDGDAAGSMELLNDCTLEMILEAYETQTGSLAERQREIIPDMTQTTEVPVFEDNISEVYAQAAEGPEDEENISGLPMGPWDPAEWEDDVTAPGFEGERWDDDLN